MTTKRKQARKRESLRIGEAELESLVAMDYRVHQFETYHFRINERLDVWPSSRKWYDLVSKERGIYVDLLEIVKRILN